MMHRKETLYGLISLCILFNLASCIHFSKDRDRGHFIPISQQPVSLNFEEHRKLILIDAIVNGQQGTFLFDNGFTLSALNADFAKQAGVKFKGSTQVTDGNNRKMTLQEATVGTVDIGGQIFKKTGFYLIDTRKFFPCKSIDGVIGASIINKANWKLDFENKVMHLGITPFEEEGVVLPIKFSSNNNTRIDLRIEDHPFMAKVDLGKSDHLEFRQRDFHSLFEGDTVTRYAGIHSLSVSGLGDIDTTIQAVEKYSIYQGEHLIKKTNKITLTPDLKHAAYLGIEWFKDYLLVINSTQKQYLLSPIEEMSVKADSTFGITIYPIEGTYRIIQLNLDQPEISDRLELMREVKQINGRPMDSFKNLCDFFSYYRDTVLKSQKMSLLLEGENNPFELKKVKPAQTVLK